MIGWLVEWQQNRQLRKDRRTAAWRDALVVGSDGITTFERRVINALEPITGPFSLTRAGPKMPYLWGAVSNTRLVLYIYGDEAQVHGDNETFRKERWDYDSPEAYIEDLVSFVKRRLSGQTK